MEKTGQTNYPHCQVSGPLQNAQGAGVQTLDELQVITKPQQQQAGQGNKQV